MVKQIAVIGCGKRAHCYLRQLRKEMAGEWRLAAVADPRDAARDVYVRSFGDSGTLTFPDGPALLEALNEKLDAVVIGSPMPLTGIAAAVGYNSSSSFFKVFKRETGKTPAAYARGLGDPSLAS